MVRFGNEENEQRQPDSEPEQRQPDSEPDFLNMAHWYSGYISALFFLNKK